MDDGEGQPLSASWMVGAAKSLYATMLKHTTSLKLQQAGLKELRASGTGTNP